MINFWGPQGHRHLGRTVRVSKFGPRRGVGFFPVQKSRSPNSITGLPVVDGVGGRGYSGVDPVRTTSCPVGQEPCFGHPTP